VKPDLVPKLVVSHEDCKLLLHDLFLESPAFFYARQWDPA
jgi:hypothetical protein